MTVETPRIERLAEYFRLQLIRIRVEPEMQRLEMPGAEVVPEDILGLVLRVQQDSTLQRLLRNRSQDIAVVTDGLFTQPFKPRNITSKRDQLVVSVDHTFFALKNGAEGTIRLDVHDGDLVKIVEDPRLEKLVRLLRLMKPNDVYTGFRNFF